MHRHFLIELDVFVTPYSNRSAVVSRIILSTLKLGKYFCMFRPFELSVCFSPSQRRPCTSVDYLRTGVSEKRLYSEINPINSPPRRQENPLARISTTSNEASQLSVSFSKGTRALREDISKNSEGLFGLILIFQRNHRLSWRNNLLWNIKKNWTCNIYRSEPLIAIRKYG